MRTADARANRRVQAQAGDVLGELVPADILDAVHGLQPALDRLRRGEWRVMVTGPRSAQDRDAAAMFHVRLIDLADALEARK